MNRMSKTALPFVLVFASSVALADKTAGDHVDDSWIHTKVKTALVGHGSSDINIEVYHGVVQLAGFVNSETEEKAALDRAASVKGVTSVSDSLHVVAKGRSAGRTLDDNVLTGSVKGSLSNAGLGGVNVEVNRGVVLLSGFVNNAELRDKAIKTAESVDNVQSVIDGMDIKSGN